MIAGISAGHKLPGESKVREGKMWGPFAILKGKEDKYEGVPLPGAPADMAHALTANGYLTEDLYDARVADWIVREVNKVRGERDRWHMLPMDGAGPHQFCYRALRKLWESRIYVPGMPSHTSQLFQMLDTHCFHYASTPLRW